MHLSSRMETEDPDLLRRCSQAMHAVLVGGAGGGGAWGVFWEVGGGAGRGSVCYLMRSVDVLGMLCLSKWIPQMSGEFRPPLLQTGTKFLRTFEMS